MGNQSNQLTYCDEKEKEKKGSFVHSINVYILRYLCKYGARFPRIVSDFNETFCTCLFSLKTKSFILNSIIFTSVAMETESKDFDQKVKTFDCINV